jgi:hypothetical protein
LRGAVEVARFAFRLPQVRKGRGEPDVAPDLAGDGSAFLQHRSCGVQVAQPAMGNAEAIELPCLLVAVAQFSPDGQAALQEPETCLEFALLVQQHPEPVGQPAQRCSGVIRSEVDGPFQPPPPFGDMTVPEPELSERLDQPQAGRGPLAVGGAGLQRPAQGGPQVVMLGLQAVEPGQMLPAVQLLGGLLGKGRVMLGMPAPGLFFLAGLGQALQGVLADRLQHARPRLAVGALGHRDQADVQQRGYQVQRIGSGGIADIGHGHRGQGIEVTAPGEYARPAERPRNVRL